MFARLLGVADALVVNMTASVLADRGIEDVVHRAVDRGLVAVMLPAVKRRRPITAGHARIRLADRGHGRLLGALRLRGRRRPLVDDLLPRRRPPDSAARSTGRAVRASRRHQTTGEGSFVDLSQQEVLWLQLGEGIAQRSMTGREPGRLGNRDPGSAASVLPPVLTFADGYADGTFAARGLVERVTHPVTGDRDYLTVPVRIDGRPSLTVRPCTVLRPARQGSLRVGGHGTGRDPEAARRGRDRDSTPSAPGSSSLDLTRARSSRDTGTALTRHFAATRGQEEPSSGHIPRAPTG